MEAVESVTQSGEAGGAVEAAVGAVEAAVDAATMDAATTSTAASTALDVAGEVLDTAFIESAEAVAVSSAEALLTAETASAVGSAAVSGTVGVADAVTKATLAGAGIGGVVKFINAGKLARDLWSTYSGLLYLHPLVTKSFTGSVLYTLSDTVTQGAVEDKAVEDMDAERLRRFAIWGIIDAIMTHNWYKILDGATQTFYGANPPAGDWHPIAFQVAADQLVYAPVWFVVFFSFSGVYEGKSWESTFKR